MKKTHSTYLLAYTELRNLTKKKVTTAHNKTKNNRAIVKIGIFISCENFVIISRKFLPKRVFIVKTRVSCRF